MLFVWILFYVTDVSINVLKILRSKEVADFMNILVTYFPPTDTILGALDSLSQNAIKVDDLRSS